MAIIYRYKSLQGQLAPLIAVGVKIGNRWLPLEVYVDSGVAYTVLHTGIAKGIGFDYRRGRPVYLQVGDGSFIPVYLHSLEIQVCSERFVAPVGFSDKLGISFNLLGHAGIFERFEIYFCEKQGTLSFDPTL